MRAVRKVVVTFSFFAVGAILSAAGCDEGTIPQPLPGPAAWNRAVTRPDDATAATMRASCGYQAGALPGETLGASTPVDTDIPIQKIVVIMQENRSFDSYYSQFAKFANRPDVEVAPENVQIPQQPGVAGSPMVSRAHAPHKCTLDTDHSWHASHEDYDNGKMDGFYAANNDPSQPNDEGDGARALFYYDQTDLPFYYNLANTFGIADHYHCGLLGPTWPNRMFFYSATSFGHTDNSFPDLTGKTYPDVMTSIFDELEQRQVSWNIFADSTPGAAVVYATTIVDRWGRNPILRSSDLMTQIAAGTLPQVSFIDGELGEEGPAGNDEHPPGDIEIGQQFVANIILALEKSPDWGHIAFFLTYDEGGGFYDHVVPPSNACPPDSTAAILNGDDAQYPGGFNIYGYRVPLLVVSPYAKKNYVSHNVYDHTSITRFIETKFRLPALTNRDANADPLMDFFDFKNPPFVTPPPLTEPSIDPTEANYCKATYSNSSGG